MKTARALLLALVLLASCSGDDFESKLRSFQIGMGKQQVERALGTPSHVFTRTNYWGTWYVDTSEWWQYAGDTKDGQVYFGTNGGVRCVYGLHGRIIPPE